MVTDQVLLQFPDRNKPQTWGPGKLPPQRRELLPHPLGSPPAAQRGQCQAVGHPGDTSTPRCGRAPGSGSVLGVGRRRSGVPCEVLGQESQGRARVHTLMLKYLPRLHACVPTAGSTPTCPTGKLAKVQERSQPPQEPQPGNRPGPTRGTSDRRQPQPRPGCVSQSSSERSQAKPAILHGPIL